jgi:glucose/arabinose dehydrogenase
MRQMRGLLLLALLAWVPLAGCDKKEEPPSPDPGDPSGAVQVSGGERIGWNQRASDRFELSLFQYVIYVDGARAPLTGANCSTNATAAGFECSAPLPPLALGAHTLEIATVVMDPAGALESARSEPLRVVMIGTTGRRSSFTPVPVRTGEGVTLQLDHVTDGLQDPVDIALRPDGAILVAERAGTVREVSDGALAMEVALDLSADVTLPDGGLLAITLDPRFNETGFMYALYAAPAPRGGVEVMLARFRSVNDRFAERAILFTRTPASLSRTSGALRVGTDGKLYVGVEGEILRLNTDATTPDDHVPITPVYASDHPDPKGFDWHPRTSDLWVIDGVHPSGGRLSAVQPTFIRQGRAVTRTAYTLPQGTGAGSATFYRGDAIPIFRGDLFVAAAEARELIRLRFDPADATRIKSVDRLLKDEIGPVRVVAEGPDGALYLASDTALYRLRP